MREILPGLFHFSAIHERIKLPVSSYYAPALSLVIDPMLPAEGIDWFREHGPPANILLTNRHHYRHSGDFVDAFGCTVGCHRAGLHEFSADQPVEPFDFGDEPVPGVVALEVDSICPEETALELRPKRAIALADGLVRWPDDDGPLSFVPDELIGDHPDAVRRGLLEAFTRLLELDFDHLLLAHGGPVEDGKAALRKFVETQSTSG
ncbi:MAG: hypothetical protein QOD76_504 [Solirubrobacteraceae bacterium]|jgi:hypothetical protein|nr:hypothetical protein [Solirubrobacteraceae bacterium]